MESSIINIVNQLKSGLTKLELKLKESLITEQEEQEDEIKQLKDKLRQAMAIVETITYVGTDWGHGKFELSEHHIKEARRLYEMYEDK
ncbi:MAG: hypothetical protein GY810_01255 [Aureispira sp.]|nr:hypothetical protein [Aureispira sp.]